MKYPAKLLPFWFALPALAAGQVAPAPKVTFYRDIAPIVYQNCSSCHRPGEAAPFDLLTYEDVKRRASQIATVTKKRYMPPSLAEPGYGEFLEERRLTAAQIQTIEDWVRQGAAPGSPADAPPPPKFSSGWQLGPPDLVLRVQHPYRLPASGQEVFWNFVVPVPIISTRWVRAVELRPGVPRAVHHASIIVDRSRSSRKREASPGAGFSGMDLSVAETTFDPDGTFLAWKPGSITIAAPDGMAWRAGPGMDFVLNVHLRPTGKPEVVAPEIGIYFTDKPQTKYPMLVELEHDGAIDIPAGDRDYVLTDEYRCPVAVDVLAVYPHAHYLGKLLEGYATLPDGTRKWLIRIPNWDLNWQGVFHLRKPIRLPAGAVISMRFHYDNSGQNVRNPNRPPKRVRGGSEAGDEMGNLWLQLLPVEAGDHRAALEEALMKRRLQKYPNDFSSNFNIGDLLLSRGDPTGAIRYFELAWKAEPRNAYAATELGVALASASRVEEAIAQFKRALEIDPAFTDARFDLASIEAQRGEWEAAAANFRQVVSAQPDNAKARQHLGEVLFLWGDQLAKSGNFSAAVERYREALIYRDTDPELHMTLGMALARLSRFADAQKEFETTLRLNPNFEPAKKALAAIRTR